ncbi:MAG TPA: cation transporter [Propionibacteriaceae bacterium]|jgi:copper chaperone CopZ
MSSTTTYAVAGMTCGHCVSSVTEELTKIAGVSDVQVDLASGTVSVAGESPLDDAAVREAVEEAGYELVPS